jgi:hypothetical protein
MGKMRQMKGFGWLAGCVLLKSAYFEMAAAGQNGGLPQPEREIGVL